MCGILNVCNNRKGWLRGRIFIMFIPAELFYYRCLDDLPEVVVTVKAWVCKLGFQSSAKAVMSLVFPEMTLICFTKYKSLNQRNLEEIKWVFE